jgi:hypothetical protein
MRGNLKRLVFSKRILGLALGVLVILLLIPVILSALPDQAKAQGGGRYYPGSGHTVDQIFLETFDSLGGLPILGYPITEAFIDPESGLVVQYFQNIRLEVAQEASGKLVVQPSSLGDFLGKRKPPLSAETAEPGCQFFHETGHYVCYGFLGFYVRNGGPEVFGYPISEFTTEQDRLVQYFEHVRLDWFPNEGGSGEVRLAPLGKLHFEKMGYSDHLQDAWLSGRQIDGGDVVELRAKPSVRWPILKSEGEQEIFIVVRDQNDEPVQGAAVMLIAHFSEGNDRTVVMPSTDQEGRSRVTLTYQGQPPGTSVQLELWVVYGNQQLITRDSFLIWW